MTPSLREAIETLRELPEEEQDFAAEFLFVYLSSDERQYRPVRSSRTTKQKPTNP